MDSDGGQNFAVDMEVNRSAMTTECVKEVVE